MLKLWERVTVKVPVGEFDASYVTRVQNVNEEGLHLDRPGIEGRLFPLRVGGEVVVEFTREDAIYRFRSQVMRFYQEANLPFMVISHPQEIERAQRRQFFRLELEMPIRYYIPIDLSRQFIQPAQKGRVKDLSAGGICFFAAEESEEKLQVGSVIQVSFTLEKQLSIFRQEARVLRVSRSGEGNGALMIMCRFENIPSYLQEAIVVHNIRHQQRFRLEKGR